MSLKPSHLQQNPVGNTPAVCLTQSLPPDQDASILLLGCGDIRNVLFTIYAGIGLGDRKLDFTCCDLWNIYYHVLLDAESLSYLQAQAKKPVANADSIDEWHNGPYGSLIRFCDTTTFAKGPASKLKLFNPMIGCLRSGLLVHYGTNPLLGFHLATVYAQLSAESPLKHPDSSQGESKSFSKSMKAAQHQFFAWADACRKACRQVTIRFVNSEAITFCHVLQHHRTHGKSDDSNWYRSQWEYNPLILDSLDYTAGGSAPICFDVIDTSNLMDHLGSINVLAAAAPLLATKPSSVLRTEMLIPRETTVTNSAKTLLCGDLPTLALLLGLKPIQYWTNATATWNMNESLLNKTSREYEIGRLMSRHIILWKPVATSMIRYDVQPLAKLVFGTYLEMFQDESWARRTLSMDLQSQAQKIRQFDTSDVVDWPQFIHAFIEMVLNDQTLNMGAHYKFLDFVDWRTIAIFKDFTRGYGTPVCHMLLQSSITPKQNIFPDIQVDFGTITISGKPFTDDFVVHVEQDHDGWDGRTPLVISAIVSTCFLVEYGDTSCGVSLAVKNTPANVALLASKLGIMLNLHKSAVGRDDVFISRYRPNMSGHMSVGCAPAVQPESTAHANIRVQPFFTTGGDRVTTLQFHYDITSNDVKELLKSGASVKFELPNPFLLVADIGSGRFCEDLELPLPLNSDRGKGRIARNSTRHVIVEREGLRETRPDMVFPTRINHSSGIALDHLHYVAPNVLPMMHIRKIKGDSHWLALHTSPPSTMSVLERLEYEKSKSSPRTGRVGFKDSMFSITMHVTGLKNCRKSAIFGLDHPSSGVVNVILFVDALRMDLSNQTVFLDAAAIPLDHDMLRDSQQHILKVQERGDMVLVKVNEVELLL
ncbi:hypothetical protein K469DRAFT_792236 [Zopfia rhizophila CBS 207.26]|uniref:DUF4470 domain-containing protein n=1 Tax=Zopfia rhizophila CBS 207.26 TaxID=1314779 RepID=A0A6A6DQE5_9PEZI|nr:hypothetical protein K469DRAFT_792236 [Zopfia rhizophila CBS 207.26]